MSGRGAVPDPCSGSSADPMTRARTPHWADRSYRVAEATYSPYTPRHGRMRPVTAPVTAASPTSEAEMTSSRIDVDDLSTLVSRLTRPNTSTARKAVLWSQPRREYEYNYLMGASLKNPSLYWMKFPALEKHYPGTWRVARTGELQDIVARLSRSTVSTTKRRDDCVARRRVIERVKEAAILADIGYRDRIREARTQAATERQMQLVPLSLSPEGQRSPGQGDDQESIPESARQIKAVKKD